MAEPTTQVRHVNVASGQRGRSENHGGMLVVALPETARQRAQALAVQLDGGTHLDQRLGEAETVLVHGLVHDRQAVGLGQGHHERLLPVGHEPGMHVRLDRHGLQVPARMPETNALVRHLEFAAHLAEHVEERDHLRLGGTLDENVTVRGERGGRPGRRLDAIRQRRVRVPLQFLDTLDAEGAINVHRNDCAHLLQHAHQIHDLRLSGRARQFGLALGQHGRQ